MAKRDISRRDSSPFRITQVDGIDDRRQRVGQCLLGFFRRMRAPFSSSDEAPPSAGSSDVPPCCSRTSCSRCNSADAGSTRYRRPSNSTTGGNAVEPGRSPAMLASSVSSTASRLARAAMKLSRSHPANCDPYPDARRNIQAAQRREQRRGTRTVKRSGTMSPLDQHQRRLKLSDGDSSGLERIRSRSTDARVRRRPHTSGVAETGAPVKSSARDMTDTRARLSPRVQTRRLTMRRKLAARRATYAAAAGQLHTARAGCDRQATGGIERQRAGHRTNITLRHQFEWQVVQGVAAKDAIPERASWRPACRRRAAPGW